ncbi:hypothetical protein J2T60_000756 [Natronospira proteinivora]|uniref:DUF7931 domain-containing protein n=1 Tax=Natronospira proteinivora TaxID=1807133 RepID=A0ABT1G667_9GAMM|nr:hypothetical protein [Natronospira proteinivora]MCP1726791.1 hypothetical protein [Natronospira proteinivora]
MSEETQDAESQPLESRDDSRQAAATLAGLVRRELIIFSHNLEPPVLDHAEIIDPLRQFVVASRHTRIRVLTVDPVRALRDGHGLVRLAQRLPTHIQMHRPHEDDADARDTFIVADETAYLYRTLADRYEGRWSEYDPVRARQLRKRFDALWERSKPESEFRRLGV